MSKLLCISLILSIGVNQAANYYYRHDPILQSAPRLVKLPTWLRYIGLAGLMTLFAYLHPSAATIPRLILFALFTLPALTDFETRYLPPDIYTYSAVLSSLAIQTYMNGIDGITHALLTETLCFMLLALAVIALRATAPGDIKVMMQFGAACGTLDTVFMALISQSLLLLVLTLGYWLRRRRWLRALPLATLLWAGLGLAWGFGA